jgi:hypothetical protein
MGRLPAARLDRFEDRSWLAAGFLPCSSEVD